MISVRLQSVRFGLVWFGLEGFSFNASLDSRAPTKGSKCGWGVSYAGCLSVVNAVFQYRLKCLKYLRRNISSVPDPIPGPHVRQ